MDVVIDPKTNVYKRFIEELRLKDLKKEYLVLNKNVIPKLRQYVKTLRDVQFSEDKAHVMYGEIKVIVTSFIRFYNKTMNETIKTAHDYIATFTKNELIELTDVTIDTQIGNQIEFSKEYLPVTSKEEQETYERIQRKYDVHMNRLNKIACDINKLDKQFKVAEFLENMCPISIRNTKKLLEHTHTYMALMLAGRLQEIDISVEVILLRVCNNLKDLRFHCEGAINSLLHVLYDKNKEWIYLKRQSREMTVDIFEVEHAIEDIRRKIKIRDPHLFEINEEVEHWTRLESKIDRIANTLRTLQIEAKNVEVQYNYVETGNSDLSGEKLEEAVQKLVKRRKLIYNHILEISRALFSLYQIRGTNEVLHKDKTGEFYIDEYGHKVYSFDSHLRTAHVACDGRLREDAKSEKYFYDDHGRYVIDETGKKLYKIAPCASMYELDKKTDFFRKVTKDCGHSEHLEKQCKMKTKYEEAKIMPDSKPIAYAGTLSKEAVDYLHDAFGAILPPVLSEVAKHQPRNPIQYLAHQLLRHKYRMSKHVFEGKKKRAEQYRDLRRQEATDKRLKDTKTWQEKNLVKKHISDDGEEVQNLLMNHDRDTLYQAIVDYNINC